MPSCPASVVTLDVDGVDIIECASASGLSSRITIPEAPTLKSGLMGVVRSRART